MTDLYTELGVQRTASSAEIKRAFRSRAKTAHPDGGGDAEDFARLKQAYEVLHNPARRLAYDRTGKVDDDEPDNERSSVYQMIAALLDQMMAQIPDDLLPRVDLLQMMETHFLKQKEGAERAIEEHKAKAKKIEKLAKRFKTKAADDPILRILDGRKAQMEFAATRIAADITRFQLGIALLKTYTFSVEVVVRQHHPDVARALLRAGETR